MELQSPRTNDAVEVNVPFQITAKGMEDGGYGRKESLFFTEGKESFRAGGKNCVQQYAFLEKQGSELRWNRKGNMEVRTVWK